MVLPSWQPCYGFILSKPSVTGLVILQFAVADIDHEKHTFSGASVIGDYSHASPVKVPVLLTTATEYCEGAALEDVEGGEECHLTQPDLELALGKDKLSHDTDAHLKAYIISILSRLNYLERGKLELLPLLYDDVYEPGVKVLCHRPRLLPQVLIAMVGPLDPLMLGTGVLVLHLHCQVLSLAFRDFTLMPHFLEEKSGCDKYLTLDLTHLQLVGAINESIPEDAVLSDVGAIFLNPVQDGLSVSFTLISYHKLNYKFLISRLPFVETDAFLTEELPGLLREDLGVALRVHIPLADELLCAEAAYLLAILAATNARLVPQLLLPDEPLLAVALILAVRVGVLKPGSSLHLGYARAAYNELVLSSYLVLHFNIIVYNILLQGLRYLRVDGLKSHHPEGPATICGESVLKVLACNLLHHHEAFLAEPLLCKATVLLLDTATLVHLLLNEFLHLPGVNEDEVALHQAELLLLLLTGAASLLLHHEVHYVALFPVLHLGRSVVHAYLLHHHEDYGLAGEHLANVDSLQELQLHAHGVRDLGLQLLGVPAINHIVVVTLEDQVPRRDDRVTLSSLVHLGQHLRHTVQLPGVLLLIETRCQIKTVICRPYLLFSGALLSDLPGIADVALHHIGLLSGNNAELLLLLLAEAGALLFHHAVLSAARDHLLLPFQAPEVENHLQAASSLELRLLVDPDLGLDKID